MGLCVGHFIEICKVCEKVIKQCRCMDKNKAVIYSICDDCKKKETVKELKDEINKGEKLLVEFFRGITGDFYRLFFDAAMKADNYNLFRLEEGFPEEIQAVRRYKNEEGYWEQIQSKYDIQYKRGDAML